MTNDSDLAGLLGETPRTPDPGFRFAVFGRVAERASRRAGLRRALRTIAVFAAIGAVFPLAGAAGLNVEAARAFLLFAGVLASACLLALVSIEGPGGIASRLRVALSALS